MINKGKIWIVNALKSFFKPLNAKFETFVNTFQIKTVNIVKSCTPVFVRLYCFIRLKTKIAAHALSYATIFCAVGALAVSSQHLVHNVSINVEGKVTQVSTIRSDANAILREQKIPYDPSSRMRNIYDANGNLSEIHLDYAKNITIHADGKDCTVTLYNGSVNDALSQANLTLGKLDKIDVPTTTEISNNMKVNIQRVKQVVTTQKVTIPYTSVTVASAVYNPFVKVLLSTGVPGQKEVTTTKTYVDGVLTTTNAVNKIISQPVNRTTLVGGTAGKPISKLSFSCLKLDKNGRPVNYKKVLKGSGTAYGTGTRTASGMHTGVGYVAVNPSLIPYGSKLYICSTDGKIVYGCAIAADTGPAAVSGNIVADLFFTNRNDITMFGRRNIEVYVLQ